MRLEARTSQRLEQRLLPQMLQSIEVLQLATSDLLALVAQELQQNEVLEAAAADDLPDLDACATAAEAEWEAPGVRATVDEVDGKRAFLESQPAPGPSLCEHVRLQVAFQGLPGPLGAAVVTLAGHLDARGLLPFTTEELVHATGLDAALLGEALDVLRALEPRGIGARSAVDALLLQLAGDPDYPLLQRLLTEHLDALARNKLPEVARALQIGTADLQLLLDRMRDLDPRPGAAFAAGDTAPVRPEVHAWLRDGEVQVALVDGTVPDLVVDAAYEALARDRAADRGVRDYVRAKVRQAKDLIGAISMRQATLLRVATAMMQRQRAFLVHGRAALRPLRMSDLAAELDMHTSTVSRAIAGKHVSTALGTFRLRDFFDGGREGALPAAGQARGAVAQRIAEMIAAEDRTSPLSDDAIVAALRASGIEMARRTVTKFRRQLGIPSSYRRRRHGRSS